MKRILSIAMLGVGIGAVSPAMAWGGLQVGVFTPAPYYHAPQPYIVPYAGGFYAPHHIAYPPLVRYRPLRQVYYAPQPFFAQPPRAYCPPQYRGYGRSHHRGPVGYGGGWN